MPGIRNIFLSASEICMRLLPALALLLLVAPARAAEKKPPTEIEAMTRLLQSGGCTTLRTRTGHAIRLTLEFHFGCLPGPKEVPAGKKPPRKPKSGDPKWTFNDLLKALPHLESLELGRLASRKQFDAIATLKNLNNLNISYAEDVRDDDLKQLKSLKSLRSLSLGNSYITGTGLAHLKDVPLVALHIHGGLTDDGLKAIGQVKSLMQLYITLPPNAKITDRGIAQLGNLSKLQWLHIYDYRRKQVSDATIVHFTNCRKLLELNLQNSSLTDKAVPHLLKLKRLNKLHLPSTVSPAAIRRLIDGLPNTKIYSPHTVERPVLR